MKMPLDMQSGESRSRIGRARKACTGALVAIAGMSCIINILALTGSFFMIEVYDRVIPSRSMPTLVGLCVLAATLYIFQGILEAVRGRLLVRVGARFDETISGAVHGAMMKESVVTSHRGGSLQPLRDLDQLRAYLSGLGPTALFDLPWVVVYIGICFLFHPLIGLAALGGAFVLIVMTVVVHFTARASQQLATEQSERRMSLAEATRRNAETIATLGMMPRMADRWATLNASYMASQFRLSDVQGTASNVSKTFRMMLQSGVLALGAFLVIEQMASGGVMLAASILVARALAPIELTIAHWSGMLSARKSLSRIDDLLANDTDSGPKVALDPPTKTLSFEGVAAAAPGGNRLLLRDITFSVRAGEAIGIVGESASGKSTLARLCVGAWQPAGGKVRLDGAVYSQWTPESLGQHIGYLPQDVGLISGTIAQNIARFDPKATSDAIMAAAKSAGSHELILRLPDGYQTQVGDSGMLLSAGQRQRIALARALYGNPFLVVLDEPNSNLDSEGERALSDAILNLRLAGRIVIVVAHRASALLNVGTIIVMKDGQIERMGDRDTIVSFIKPAQPQRSFADIQREAGRVVARVGA